MLHFIGYIIIGGIAGWLAGRIMTGEGYGILLDIILGVVGGIIGGWIIGAILNQFGHATPTGVIAEFLIALVGAIILVGIIHLVKREPLRTG
jgi:uncharacterized membrane protein YeaQ/YmgE (transglycosylase-associated protein family)